MDTIIRNKFRILTWVAPSVLLCLLCVLILVPLTEMTTQLESELNAKQQLDYKKSWLDSANKNQSQLLSETGTLLEKYRRVLQKTKSADAISKTIRNYFITNQMEVSRITTEESLLSGLKKVSVRVSGNCQYAELANLLASLQAQEIFYEITGMTLRKRKSGLSFAITIETFKLVQEKPLAAGVGSMKLVYLFLNKWYIFAGLFITVWSINFTLSSLPQNSSPEKSSVFSLQRHWDFLKEIKKAETAYTNANISPDSLTNKSGPFRIHSHQQKTAFKKSFAKET